MSGDEDRPGSPGLNRRALISWAGAAGVAGAAGGAVIGAGIERAQAGGPAPAGESGVPAPGPDLADRRLGPADAPVRRTPLPQGLADRVPAFGQVLSLDLAPHVRDDPRRARRVATRVLRALSGLADRAAAGEPAGSGSSAAALDLRPASLQVTPGVGASLLSACSLSSRRPAGLVDLPRFTTDRLEAALSGGDLLVQLGAEDPMRLAGATQEVLAVVGDDLRVRWSRSGFRPTAAAAEHPRTTVRNLMGHRDGTNNPDLGTPLWHSTVAVNDPGSWMDSGSYLVARRIRIDLEGWFGHDQAERDAVIGRSTTTGAPLSTHRERAPVPLDRRRDGQLAIGPRAHIRLASTRNTAGARIYRRSWNFDDGWRPDGSRDAGLMFLAWQADPRTGFIAIQRSLVESGDRLSDFTTHVGSAAFAVPARGDDDYVAQRLLES